MASNKKILKATVEELGIRFDPKKLVAYGRYQKYSVLINGSNTADRNQHIILMFAMALEGNPPEITQSVADILPGKAKYKIDGYTISLDVPIKGEYKKEPDALAGLIKSLVFYFDNHGYENCDIKGTIGATDVYMLRGNWAFLNAESTEEYKQSLSEEAKEFAEKKERVLPGIIGALIGAAAGALLVFCIARLGIISSGASFLMGIAVVIGYKWKGVKLSAFSAVLCTALTVGFTYLAFRLDTAFTIHKALGKAGMDSTISECFTNAKSIMQAADSMSVYEHNFLLMMGIGTLSAVVSAWIVLASQKEQYQVERLK